MFFRRFLAFVTVAASFALLSHARPMHHARAAVVITTTTTTVDSIAFINNMKAFQKDIESCSDEISKAASTGGDPEAEMKKLTGLFANVELPNTSLSINQEKELTGIMSLAITKAINSCHQVGAKHNFMKYYAKWTDMDFSMHSFTQKLAGVSFSMYKELLISAGKSTAIKCHDMKMRHMVNDFRGMGVSYE